jgi:FG-GAP repeat
MTNIVAHNPVANPGPSWRAVGTGDFNGDGKSDILLQNTKRATLDMKDGRDQRDRPRSRG